MFLPNLKVKRDGVTVVKQFGGVNRNLSINDGEWADMMNMTNDNYPVLTNRKKRAFIKNMYKPQGMVGGKALAYVDGNDLYYDGTIVKTLDDGGERQLVVMGAYLCVFPDGFVLNTLTREEQYIEFECNAKNVTPHLYRKSDDTEYVFGTNILVGGSAPDDHTKDWFDNSQEVPVAKTWSESYSMYVPVDTYIDIPEISALRDFKKGETFEITEGVFKGYHQMIKDSFTFDGIIKPNEMDIYVRRKCPRLDYVCEMDNRIWGCYHGFDDKGEMLNEIYACKQGDPCAWYDYSGIASDSYAASVGTQNPFTGIASYNGSVYFFKEDGYHKLYGSMPSNYQLVWKPGRGVQYGSSKSVQICNGYLMWKSNDGIVLYDGSENVVSENLGVEAYYEAVASVFRAKYYITMRDSNYQYRMFVFDALKGMWAIEDDTHAIYMATSNQGLFYITQNNEMWEINTEALYEYIFPQSTLIPGTFYPGFTTVAHLEQDFEWSFETGDIDVGSPYTKYLKRVLVRVWLDVSSKLKIEAMYDSSDEWINVIEYYSTRKKSYEIPIPIQRCDHMRLRFSGWGEFRMYSVTKCVEEGTGTNE